MPLFSDKLIWVEFRNYFLLTIITLLMLLPGISALPMLDRDSAHFAQATKQMTESKDYWQIQFQNQPRHLKPPGIYWLQALSVNLLSFSESTAVWPYRLPSVLGGLLSVLLLYAFAKKQWQAPVAIIAALSLAASFLLNIEARQAVTDAVFLATNIMTLGALWLIYADEKEKRSNLLLKFIFWFGIAFGILIKGLTPIFALIIYCSLWLVDRKNNLKGKLSLITGIFFVAAFTLSWLVWISYHTQSNFLSDMFYGDLLPKITSGQESHGMPPGYFSLLFIWLFWPTSLFFFQAAIYGWQFKKDKSIRFLLIWSIALWLLFELIPTKLPEYILPAYPAVALLTACAILNNYKIEKSKILDLLEKIYVLFWIIFNISFAIFIGYISILLENKINATCLALAVIIIFSTIIIIFSYFKRKYISCFIQQIIMATVTFILIFQFILPQLQPLWLSQNIYNFCQKNSCEISAQKPLIALDYQEPSLVFYFGKNAVKFKDSTEISENFIKFKNPTEVKNNNLKNSQIFLVENNNKIFFKKIQNHYKKLHEFRGYNYSNGQWLTLELIVL